MRSFCIPSFFSTGNPLVSVYDKTANNVMGGMIACRSYARKEDLNAFIKKGGKSIGVFADEGFYLGNSSIRSRLKSMPWKKKQLAVSSALYPIAEIVQQLNEFQPDMLGGYPSNLELLIVEPVDADGNPVPDGVQSDKIYLTNLYNYTQPYIRYEVTDRVIMHHEPCGCGNTAPWLELEGRADDVTTFTQEGKEIKIAPLSLYAVLKEVHSLRRFQVLVYPENRLELRIEEKNGVSKEAAFKEAKACLVKFLASQNIVQVTIMLSEEAPKQNPNSGKFKHIINVQMR